MYIRYSTVDVGPSTIFPQISQISPRSSREAEVPSSIWTPFHLVFGPKEPQICGGTYATYMGTGNLWEIYETMWKIWETFIQPNDGIVYCHQKVYANTLGWTSVIVRLVEGTMQCHEFTHHNDQNSQVSRKFSLNSVKLENGIFNPNIAGLDHDNPLSYWTFFF